MRAAPVTFADALRFWLKLGFISFGGPAGQIAVMHEELVVRRRWISERRFLHALNYCMVLPGPEAQQLATYIGWLLHGVRGGIAAGGLFVLPSLLILIGLSALYMAFGQLPAVAAVLWGIKPAVVAIVAHAAWRIGARVLTHPLLWAIAGGAFLGLTVFALPFPLVILAAAGLGALGGRWWPRAFRGRAAGTSAARPHAPAVIDDDTATPAHARLRWPRLAAVLATGLALWALGLAGLAGAYGVDGLYARMGLFFSQAALLTFGGAYAVLPYVYQAAVLQHGWLSAGQMVDGLALGETTPGPLIMVVAFVGFVAGWGQGSAEQGLWAGVLGACVATYFTFLPSFLFIFAGGPLVEASRGELRLTAPLGGVTAAVVGVIANLALFLGGAVLWPAGEFDFGAALLGGASFLAIGFLRVNILSLIGSCAAIGLISLV